LDESPWFDDQALRLAEMFAQRFGCALGEACEVMLPKPLRLLKSTKLNLSGQRSLNNQSTKQLIRSQSLQAHWPHLEQKISDVLARGQGIIFLVAETSQIPYVEHRLKSVLPKTKYIHDNERTAKQELEGWVSLREGKINFVIGLRSAVFAPVFSLGLIVMFDEDNSSYKEEQSPFYQTREIVMMRSEVELCDVVMVAFSPSVEAEYLVRQKKVSSVVMVDESKARRQMIDMTNFASKGPMIISFPLRNSIEKTLAAKGRAVVVINRRGHSTFTRCLFCGHIMRCKRCSTNLSFSNIKKKLECRQCGSTMDLPKVCPHCSKNYLRSLGTGVERVASEVKRLFPAACVERFDRDVNMFPAKFDVMVTTLAVLRMMGRLRVETIGVLDIDAEFNRADYRSSQKAYSLLTHLSLMARNSIEIQTFYVDNEVLRCFIAYKDDEFYSRELALRQEIKLPPYVRWISVMLRGVDEELVSSQAGLLYQLMFGTKPEGVEVLSVQPDTIPKLRDQFRFVIFIRSENAKLCLEFVKSSLASLKKKNKVVITLHVDP